jgi:hypothetical protein
MKSRLLRDRNTRRYTLPLVTRMFLQDQEGLFTPDEKKSLFDTIKLVNDRLADNMVGRMDITLTREEYDTLMESVRLPNRFLKLEMIEVE